MRKIGGHVSAAGGVENAINRAHDIGANCVQVFSGSPRVWQRPALEKVNVDLIAQRQAEQGIMPIFTHAIYLTNLASDNPELCGKSCKVLTYDLKFDALLQGGGVVVHLGSHQGRGWDAVKENMVVLLSTILEATPDNSRFLIENSAGQQGKVCSNLGEIRWLMDQVQSPRLGWCFDTCHGFAAGHALGELTAHDTKMTITEEIEQWHLWDELSLIHVNDSRDPFASGRDRHANLGEGEIPTSDLEYFLNVPQVKDIPLILEVPGIEKAGPDAENIHRLKKIVGEE